jgi:hypothetical protein
MAEMLTISPWHRTLASDRGFSCSRNIQKENRLVVHLLIDGEEPAVGNCHAAIDEPSAAPQRLHRDGRAEANGDRRLNPKSKRI